MYEEYYGDNDYRDYLEHHGIKNQKWGVQNGPPYPLNAEGKASFRDKLEERRKQKKKMVRLKKARKARAYKIKAQKKEEKKIAKSKVKLGRTKLKDLKKMSDAEVKERIARLRLEEDLRKLEKGEKSRVHQMVEDALLDAGKQLITKTVVDAVSKALKDAMELNDSSNNKSSSDKGNDKNNDKEKRKLTKETARKQKYEADNAKWAAKQTKANYKSSQAAQKDEQKRKRLEDKEREEERRRKKKEEEEQKKNPRITDPRRLLPG